MVVTPSRNAAAADIDTAHGNTKAGKAAAMPEAADDAGTAPPELDRQTRDVVAIMLDLVRDQLSVPEAMLTLGTGAGARIVVAGGGGDAATLDPVLCRLCMDHGGRLVIEDTADLAPPLAGRIRAEAVGAYLGLALVDGAGRPFGVVCAVDVAPRRWSKRDIDTLRGLAVVLDTEFRAAGLSARAA